MPKVTIVAPNGTLFETEVPVEKSIMQAAVDLDVPGIRAECGGACACATCKVLVDPAWAAKLPAPGAMERSMLEDEEADEGRVCRLSCQIKMTEALGGLVVEVAKTFY